MYVRDEDLEEPLWPFCRAREVSADRSIGTASSKEEGPVRPNSLYIPTFPNDVSDSFADGSPEVVDQSPDADVGESGQQEFPERVRPGPGTPPSSRPAAR